MKIGFDDKRAFLNNSGLGNYSRTLIKSLDEYFPENDYTLFTTKKSGNEFEQFIGRDIRLEPVVLKSNQSIEQLLEYYMGKNTPDRQVFIINNLKVEKDEIIEDLVPVAEV